MHAMNDKPDIDVDTLNKLALAFGIPLKWARLLPSVCPRFD